MAPTRNVNDDTNTATSSAMCSSAPEFMRNDFDYLVVGGGTAGLVVAARLSEDANIMVGVLEAGKNRLGDPFIDVPAMFPFATHNPEYDWMFDSIPQKGNKNKVHSLARGKMLGGSSGINYMAYVRGSDEDYNDWAAILDNQGWSAAALKPYMRKHETLEPIDASVVDGPTHAFVAAENHGTSGPIHTSFKSDILPIEGHLIRACEEVTGLTKKPVDPRSGDHVGFYHGISTIHRTGPHKGKRSYSGRNYLEPNLGRRNLKLLCDATVAGFEIKDGVATAVNFFHGGDRHSAMAKREIVLSAGSYGSPQLLELSGIGDCSILQQAGIECKIDLPAVGRNLAEHLMTSLSYKLTPGNISVDIIHSAGVLEAAQKQYHDSRDGPLSAGSGTGGYFPWIVLGNEEEVQSTVASVRETPDTTPFYHRQLQSIAHHLESPKSANLGLILVAASANQDEACADGSKLFAKRTSDMGITMFLPVQYPCSRGSVHIASSDVTQQPTIDPGFLTHPADVTVMGVGMKLIDRAVKSAHMSDKIARRVFPDPSIDLENTAEAEQAVRDWILSVNHPTGTCAMGAVVDDRLRVKGVKQLRVVDASVFPTQISGNIVGTVYAVAEKGADLIKEDWA